MGNSQPYTQAIREALQDTAWREAHPLESFLISLMLCVEGASIVKMNRSEQYPDHIELVSLHIAGHDNADVIVYPEYRFVEGALTPTGRVRVEITVPGMEDETASLLYTRCDNQPLRDIRARVGWLEAIKQHDEAKEREEVTITNEPPTYVVGGLSPDTPVSDLFAREPLSVTDIDEPLGNPVPLKIRSLTTTLANDDLDDLLGPLPRIISGFEVSDDGDLERLEFYDSDLVFRLSTPIADDVVRGSFEGRFSCVTQWYPLMIEMFQRHPDIVTPSEQFREHLVQWNRERVLETIADRWIASASKALLAGDEELSFEELSFTTTMAGEGCHALYGVHVSNSIREDLVYLDVTDENVEQYNALTPLTQDITSESVFRTMQSEKYRHVYVSDELV